jgi:hypothetical protein
MQLVIFKAFAMLKNNLNDPVVVFGRTSASLQIRG